MNSNLPTPRRSKPDWPEIRRAYMSGAGSLRDLAIRFSVPRRTLERKASKEAWRRMAAQLGGIVAAAAADRAKEEGEQLGLSAGKLIERSLAGTELILDRLEHELKKPHIDAHALRALVSGWRDAILVGRQTHRLDDLPAREPVVSVGRMRQICLAAPAVLPPAIDVETSESKSAS